MPVEGFELHDVGCSEWGNEIVRAVPYIYYQIVKEGKKKIGVETTEGMRPFYFFLKDAQVKIKYPNHHVHHVGKVKYIRKTQLKIQNHVILCQNYKGSIFL